MTDIPEVIPVKEGLKLGEKLMGAVTHIRDGGAANLRGTAMQKGQFFLGSIVAGHGAWMALTDAAKMVDMMDSGVDEKGAPRAKPNLLTLATHTGEALIGALVLSHQFGKGRA